MRITNIDTGLKVVGAKVSWWPKRVFSNQTFADGVIDHENYEYRYGVKGGGGLNYKSFKFIRIGSNLIKIRIFFPN